MNHSLSSFVTLTMVAAFALGCASCSPSPTSPSDAGSADIPSNAANASLPAGWTDATWTLASIQPAGQAVQLAPANASYEVIFGESRISTKVDCNRCTGGMSIAGNTLTIGPALACTRAACPTMAFEHVYLELLTGESSARVDGDSLTLSSPRGVLHFRR
jgi:heat shock protein HslJ